VAVGETTARLHANVDPDVEADKWRVLIYAADQARTVTFSRAERKVVGELQPGLYRGQVWLDGASVRLVGDLPFSTEKADAPMQMLHLPLELKVYDDGTLAFRDGSSLLAGVLPQSWNFHLREDGSFDAQAGDDDLSLTAFLRDPDLAPEDAMEVTFSSWGRIDAFDDYVSGHVMAAMGGTGLAYAPPYDIDERVHARWGFSAERVGDILTDEAPPALGGGTPPQVSVYADRWDRPHPWGTEVWACGGSFTDEEGGYSESFRELVEWLYCYDHPGTMTTVSFAPASAGLTQMGDLKCADDPVRATIAPLFTYLDSGQGVSSEILTTRQMLGYCINDLEYLHGPVVSGEGSDASCLADLSGVGVDGRMRCLDGPLFLATLDHALRAVERGGFPDQLAVTEIEHEVTRLAHRLLQQWLQVHAFVAREALQQADLLFAGDMAELQDALALSLEGWDVLLQPGALGRVLHISPEVLNAPDYRGIEDPSATMSAEVTPAVGVTVAMVDLLAAQLGAVERIIHRARFENGDLPDVVRDTYRYAAVVTPLAALLHERAGEVEPPAWDELYARSVANLGEVQRAVTREWRSYEVGRNPLGIDDDDLPLYRGLFNPDEAGVRFSAISSYLIDDWADQALTDAEDARTDAETAWSGLLERQLQRAQSDDDKGRRIEEIKRQYGEKILTLCGNPMDLSDSAEVFAEDAWPGLNAASCFMNPNDSQCHWDEGVLTAKLNADDVAQHMCVVAGLKQRFGDKVKLSNDDLWDKISDMQGELNDLYDMGSGEFWQDALDPGLFQYASDFVECIGDSAGCELQQMFELDYPQQFDSDADIAAFQEARSACGAAVPGGQMISEKMPALDKPDCYSGTLGELALAARAAAKDIEVAASALGDQTEAYETAVNQCVIVNRGMEQIEAVSEQLGDLSGRLQTYMDGVGFIAEIGGLAISVVDAIAGTYKPASGGGLERGRMGSGGAAGSIYNYASGKIMEVGENMLGISDINDMHDDFVAEWTEKIENALCFNEASMHLVAADTYAKRMERAQLDLSQAILELRNNQELLSRYIVEGRGRVADETARSNASLVNDIWNDLWVGDADSYRGKTEAYRRAMRVAQRMVYLAVRAVEYEWQVSREDRATVLAATTPEELRAVLDELETDVGAGNLGGQSPENLHVVVSVRDHLLQLANREEWADGHHTCGSAEQLQLLFTSPRYAHYDAEGEYQGQLIPLPIAPLGVIGIGDAGGILLLTGADCAERVWSVNATLHGDALVEDEASFTRIELLQRNTFYSQWCEEPGVGEPQLQSSSVRPSRNLFKDPVWAGDFGNQNPDESEYVRARLQAYHNVSRSDFEAEAYNQGSSEELAARGLFGEYALFFPAEYLHGDGEGGLFLNRLDDVLLRIDYVSAAKRW
jgi:hypothetical protein